MAQAVPKLLTWDAQLLSRVESLEWRSRVLVEGFLQGSHHSLLRGFSAEFAQYQPYVAGDDTRYLDWRAYARLDRLYLRQFEAETNLRAHIVVDASGSMDYKSDGQHFRKYDYACMLAAALMRLLQTQSDAFGLAVVRQRMEHYIRPQVSRSHFLRCLSILEQTKSQGEGELANRLRDLAEIIGRRGLVVVISDFWDDIDGLVEAMKRLRYDRHEVVLMQTVDPRELDFELGQGGLFEDMETGARLPLAPITVRKRYLDALGQHQAALKHAALELGAELCQIRTDEPPFGALAQFLTRRRR